MADIAREEIERIYQTLDEGFKGIHTRLDLLNGRTRQSETKIAVLEDRVVVAPVPSGMGRGKAAAWGGGMGGIVIGAVELLKAWVSR